MTTDFVPASLREALRRTPELSQAYLVGGCVRDALLGRPVKDFDVEVHGVDYASLARALSRWGRVDLVGKAFGVAKVMLPDGGSMTFPCRAGTRRSRPGIAALM